MAGSVRTCCVPACEKTRADNVTLHQFPHPIKERNVFLTWVNVVGSSISSLSDEFIYKNRKICHDHFEIKHQTWTKKLTHGAVPTLHMPDNRSNSPTVGESAVDNHTSPAQVPSTVTVLKETPLTPSKKNDDLLQFHEETEVVSDIEAKAESDEKGPFSWEKSIVVPCDKEDVVDSELPSQIIDDNVLLYDSKPSAAKDTFTEETNEVLEELKCNQCKHIIKDGFRYSCIQCPDFDLCSACEMKGAHPMHYVLRSPRTKTDSEVKLTLRLIRQAVLADSIVALCEHPYPPKDEIKEEIEEKPEPELEKDPLPADGPAEITAQELTLDEFSDNETTKSEEDEPPRKRLTLSPLQSVKTTSTFTFETTQRSTAKENQILLQIKPLQLLKKYVPVPDLTKQSRIRDDPKRAIILKRRPKKTSLPLIGLSQQDHNSEKLVNIQTLTEKRVLLPITQSNVIVKDSGSSITPSNVNVQDKRTPITSSDIVIRDNRVPTTPSNIIIRDNRTPIKPSNIIIRDNRAPTTSRNIVPKSVPSVVIETKSELLRTLNLDPTVKIEILNSHTLNKHISGRQILR